MAGKILRSVLTVAVAVLLTSILVITGSLYSDFTDIQQRQLKDELRFAAEATQQLGVKYLEKLPSDSYRLTWVTSEGKVLFDSRADSETMENHSDREEIKEALQNGWGSSSRYSATLTEKTIYEAIRLEDQTVLRISISSDTAAALVIDMLQPMIVIAALAIILSVWLARRMAAQVVEPLNKLDLDDPMANNTYEELTPLLQRISSQHREIELQMRLLKYKQQEFDRITDNMKEALVLLDKDRRVISINPAARALLKITAACEGKLFCAEQYRPDIDNAIEYAERHGHAEFTSLSEENSYLFNISSIESDGKLHGIVILAFDVTEKAKAEKIRRDFTSNVSHELKTPLQSIIGSAELIENMIVKPEDMPRFVGHIKKEATRLVGLIDDIIRLSQIDGGDHMPTEQLSLLAVSQEACEILSHAAEQKKVSVSVSGDSAVMQGVSGLLFELVYNLVDNAIRYNKEGGEVRVSVADMPDEIALTVSDTGIGIPQEHHSQIFERFYRVDKSHSRKSGGTGLGLSIVKHAAKHHNGIIKLESEEGKGTVISVLFKKDS